MGLWILPSAGLREQTSIKTGSRLLSPPCLVIRQVPAAACWTPIREDSSLGRKTVMGHGSELNSSLSLCLASPLPHLSLVSCQALLVYPSLGPRTLSCPRPTLPPTLASPNHCSRPSRVCPQSLLTLRQHGTSKLQSLRPLLSSPNPGRFPPNSPCRLLLVCLANSLLWQVHREAIILLKAGA